MPSGATSTLLTPFRPGVGVAPHVTSVDAEPRMQLRDVKAPFPAMFMVTSVLFDGETAYRLFPSGLSARWSTPVSPSPVAHSGPAAEFAPVWLMQPATVSAPVPASRENQVIALPLLDATYTKSSFATTQAACDRGRFALLGHASVELGSLMQLVKLSAPV